MNVLIDKLTVFVLCTAFYIINITDRQNIISILIVITISAVFSYIEKSTLKIALILFFIILSIYSPSYLFFIPLIFYDVIFSELKWLSIVLLLPIFINLKTAALITYAFIITFIIFSFLLKYRTVSLQKIKNQYFQLQDNSKEMSLMLEIKNKKLMETQDNEIKLATLNERNRIARDIHDNVGHMLSSSILQIGALLATSNDEKTKENLRLINGTLSKAMNSIRDSVHDLHEESIDLHNEIITLINNFTFCSAELSYDMQSPPQKKIKYCFISIVKESLSNIIKHSNATKVSVTLREHPALFQLVIQDNGTKIRNNSDDGIGLKNITDRVNAFNGNLNINTEKGFRIFISIPKV